MLKYCIAIIFFLSSIVAFSQQREPGVWHVVNGLIKLDKNWQTFVTLQLRSNKCIKDFYYYEMQTGLGYNINPTFSFWAGMGSHNTYFEKGNFSKPIANQEFRLWQQFTINHAIQRLRIQHRIRVEERWLSIGYRTRFRYRLNMTFPLNNKQLVPKTFYLNAYDELYFKNQNTLYEGNRFFGGAGYVFTPITTLQVGYVKQYNYADDGWHIGKDFIQISLLLKFRDAVQPKKISNHMY